MFLGFVWRTYVMVVLERQEGPQTSLKLVCRAKLDSRRDFSATRHSHRSLFAIHSLRVVHLSTNLI